MFVNVVGGNTKMNFEFINTLWFKIATHFIFLVIFTIIVLKEEDKSRRKRK